MLDLKGVNLGGWLLLEKWIMPSLFEGLTAEDEYSFCLEAGGSKVEKLKQHRNSFITKDDFKWLAQNGINALRIPVGYWVLEDHDPFVNCREHLDKAFQWAEELNIKIIIDLHGAPGSHNGLHHSGRSGSINWPNSQNIDLTLDVIGRLAERYKKSNVLWGIELLNEPDWRATKNILRQFYEKGYEVVRQHCDEAVAVIISDAFRPQQWNNFMTGPDYKNVILDLHLYQCFSRADRKLDMNGHLKKVKQDWADLFRKIDKVVIVGEWSLALDPKTFTGMNEEQEKAAIKAYATAQLDMFSRAAGWFFWTYKTEESSNWNFRFCIENNLLS